MDYSDFRYQQINAQLQLEQASDTNPRAQARTDIDVLEGRGGLDQNEVAELVAIADAAAYVEIEDETDDQDVATSVECRGVLGANLPASDNAFPASPQNTKVIGELFGLRGRTEDQVDVEVRTEVDDRKFMLYSTSGGLPFDDQTNGPGGSATHDQWGPYTKNFRDMVGRGPVLDSNDDVSIAQAMNVGDTIITVSHNLRATLIWDVAETDDAGRAFSVPDRM